MLLLAVPWPVWCAKALLFFWDLNDGFLGTRPAEVLSGDPLDLNAFGGEIPDLAFDAGIFLAQRLYLPLHLSFLSPNLAEISENMKSRELIQQQGAEQYETVTKPALAEQPLPPHFETHVLSNITQPPVKHQHSTSRQQGPRRTATS